MRNTFRPLIAVAVFGLSLSAVFAQSGRPRPDSPRQSVSRSTASSINRPSSTISRTTASRPTRPTTTTSTSGSRGGSSYGSPNSGNSTNDYYDRYYDRCRAYLNSLSSFNSYYRRWYSGRDLYLSSSFLSLLGYQYGFYGFNADYALYRFANGDSILTPTVSRLALRGSFLATDMLLTEARELNGLLDRYDRGEVTRRSFNDEVKSRIKRVREAAKAIRKDYYLSYLDSNEDAKLKKPDRAKNLSELRELVSEMQALALQVKGRLVDMRSNDENGRTVTVSSFQAPSFDSMAKGIDRLAKSFSKSAKRL